MLDMKSRKFINDFKVIDDYILVSLGTGEKITPSFAGIQSLCGDAFANPYLSDGVNFTLGCDGSRKAADIKDNEMTVGISKAKIEEVINGLESI